MTKTCLACGFVSAQGARYCRMCGALLPHGPRGYEDDGAALPAATVPLSTDRHTTDDLSPHDTDAHASPARGEAAEFVRHAAGVADPPAAHVAPPDSATGTPAESTDDSPITISVRPLVTERLAGDPRDPPDGDEIDPPRKPSARLVFGRDAELADEEATLAGARPRPAVFASHPPANARADAHPAGSSRSVPRPKRTPEERALRLWGGAAVFGVALVVIVCAVVALAWLAARTFRRDSAAAPPVPTAIQSPEGAKQSAAAKLDEAERLLSAGRADEATALLREAATLDPSNAEPHRRLAALLLQEGARRTAIEELRVVLQMDASNAAAWRDLAAAQSAEGLYGDAAESYRRLLELSNAAKGDDRVGLAYADALRLAGQTEQARTLYRRLLASRDAEVAARVREELEQLSRTGESTNIVAPNAARESASPAPSPAVGAHVAAAGVTRAAEANASPTPLPTAASPKEHYERGVRLWATSRASALAEFARAAQGGNPEANYYLGLSLAEGRDPRTLKRGELVAALSYFQRARAGRFGTEARRYEDALGREYDRRRAAGEK